MLIELCFRRLMFLKWVFRREKRRSLYVGASFWASCVTFPFTVISPTCGCRFLKMWRVLSFPIDT